MSKFKVSEKIIHCSVADFEPEKDFYMLRSLEDLQDEYESCQVEIVAYDENRKTYITRDCYDDLNESGKNEIERTYKRVDPSTYLSQAAKIQAFEDQEEENTLELGGYSVHFGEDKINIGFRSFSKDDAVTLAKEVLNKYV